MKGEEEFLDSIEALCEKGQDAKAKTAKNYLMSIKKKVDERREEIEDRREEVSNRGN